MRTITISREDSDYLFYNLGEHSFLSFQSKPQGNANQHRTNEAPHQTL